MIVSAAILLLILTPIFASMLVSLPIVQNKIVQYATSFASEYLQTEVSIRRIDITMSGGVELTDLLVRDLDSDTLLYVRDLNSRLSGFNLSSYRLSLGSSSIDGATLNLRQTVRGEMNIREITTKMASKKRGGGRLSINIASVELDQMRLRIEQLTHVDPTYGVDVKNIILNELSGRADDLTIDGPMLHTHIERLSAEEQSGFQIQDVSGELYLTQGALSISNMNITTQWSSVSMPYLMLNANNWADYKYFNDTTALSIRVNSGYVSTDDIAYFSPSLRSYGITLYDLDLSAAGEVSDMVVEVANLSYGEATHISAKAELVGLPKVDQLVSRLLIGGVTTNAADVGLLYASVDGREMPRDVARIVRDLGAVTIRGTVDSGEGMSDMVVAAELESEIGDLSTSMSLGIAPKGSEQSGRITLDGDILAKHFDIGRVLRERHIGRVSMRMNLDGEVAQGHNDIAIKSDIYNLLINGYNLHDISASTVMVGNNINAEMVVDDPNLKLEMAAIASELDQKGVEPIEGVEPNYTLSLDLLHANLKALGMNQRDTTSLLTAKLTAALEGRDIENSLMRVELEHGKYSYNSNEILTGGALLSVRSVEGDRSVELVSDFMDLDFKSSSRVSQIVDYLKGVMTEYLPALYNKPLEAIGSFNGRDTSRSSLSDSGAASGELSRLKITTHNLIPITEAISTGLEVADNSVLELTFDDSEHRFDLSVKSDFVERKALLAIGVDTHISNQKDSLTFRGKFGELYIGTSQIIGAELNAAAKENQINIVSSFVNPKDSISGDIRADLRLRKSEIEGGRPTLHAELLPSSITQRERVWSLASRSIDISERGAWIDNFVVHSQNQRLSINGKASRSTADTVKMEMTNFDLSILSTLIARVGYDIEGRTNGELIASSALDNAKLEAQILLDSVSVNKIEAPAMSMDVTWDSKLNRARMILENRASRDTLMRGYYIPSQVKYYAKCEVDSLNVGLLDPLLGGVITKTEGYAHLDLTLQGQRREATLSGTIDVEDFETTVEYTGVRYSLPSAMIQVSNNRLLSMGAQIYDKVGGGGLLDLDVNLQHLSNIGYSIRILPKGMLVLNTTERDNDLFYGEIYASGMAQISGDKRGVRMNITASSDGDSQFFMPLSNKESVSNADFITFVQPVQRDTMDILASRRRNFERRNMSGNASMVINMALDVNPDTEVQLVIDPTVGDIIKARGEGQLNLSLEPKANRFEIYGDYTISEGSYLFTLQNIVNKRFVIDPNSSIQWSGSPTDARLNINAIYKLKASLQPLISDESSRSVPVDCVIQLTDLLTQPDVAFSIELPSSDSETQAMFNNLLNDQEAISRQFFYLMLANSFIPESSSTGADLGASAGAATGFELLTNQLSNWLSSSNYNVIIRYRPESELTSEELDLGFSKGLINNRLLVELEGNYVTDSNQAVSENVSNFMGEAYITWLIDRAGALRLKGFTQTIDRFDENQGLQETGIGVYYKESFENFADLRERVRARFKASDERLERREERKRRKQERRELNEATREERKRNKQNKK